MSKTFIGIGAGPIQTGIFVAGAAQGGFDRIVLAEVDPALVAALRANGSITVNTAGKDAITSKTYTNIEVLNPNEEADRAKLIEIGKDALVFNTALPATRFYPFCASWMKEAFALNPNGKRYIYASENSTTAAAELKAAIDMDLPNTYYLDTVIGKMSKVFLASESNLPPLTPGFAKGHLVEEFCTIYTSSAPDVENVGIVNLFPKADLVPFEEAKLYGHNATHFLLALMAAERGCTYMSDAAKFPEIVEYTRQALINESGLALCKKYAGVDPYFTKEGWNTWAEELVRRMVSPLLSDAVARVARDLTRKLGWADRIVGAVRLCKSQGVAAPNLTHGVNIALRFSALEALLEGDWKDKEGAAELAEELRKPCC
ncbi:MAG: hypothetical protein MJ202_02340 [Lentisphaeria bacterium]|nr:hypothetical protein [Lentisphaeria bacterium]